MDTERALDLAYRSTIDAFRDGTRRVPGSVVHEEAGVLLWAGNSSFPVLVNGVARSEAGAPADDVIARAREFFAPRGRGFNVVGLAGRDDDVIAAAEAAGLVAIGEPNPLMVTDVRPDSIELAAGVRVEAVSSAADVAAAADVCTDAYAVYGMPAEVALSAVIPSAVLQNHVVAVLAHDEDGPVATAQAIATHGVAVGRAAREPRGARAAYLTPIRLLRTFEHPRRRDRMLPSRRSRR
jgi:hypothetical protein